MSTYHDGNRELQDRFDTRRLADRIEDILCHDIITDYDRSFIEAADMFFLATADPNGKPTVGYRGGDPGFVRVVDERTIAFPNYNGNGMYVGSGNMLKNPQVGLLFIDFQRGNRLRFHGDASIDLDDPLAAEYEGAQFVIRVRATELYNNCPRYVHKMQPVERSVFVPREDCDVPVPGWKKSDWAIDVLPEGDPALDPSAPVA